MTNLVEDKESTRILGANLQRNMSWNSHLESGAEGAVPCSQETVGTTDLLEDIFHGRVD